MTPAVRGHLLRAVKLVLLGAVLWYVVAAVRRDLAKVQDWSVFKPDWIWLGLAGLSLLGVALVQMVSYHTLLAAYGAPTRWRDMACIAWIPPMGKYLPGKVWALGGAMAMLRQFGVQGAVAVSVVLMLDAFAVIAGLVVGAPLLHGVPGGQWLVAAVVIVGLVLLHPRVFSAMLNQLLQRLGRPLITSTPGLLRFAIPVACGFAQWVLAGCALWCVSRTLLDVPIAAMPRMMSIAAASMTLGYLALIAPAGIGVTEAIALPLLAMLLRNQPGSAAIAIVVWRVLRTLVEVGLAGVGLLVLRRRGSGVADEVTGTTP